MTAAHISLSGILRLHQLWLENPAGGGRADLTGLTFNESTLVGINLSKAVLTRATFLDSNLAGSDLSGASLDKVDMQRANLAGADLTGTTVIGRGFRGRLVRQCQSRRGFRHRAVFSPRQTGESSFTRGLLPAGQFSEGFRKRRGLPSSPFLRRRF